MGSLISRAFLYSVCAHICIQSHPITGFFIFSNVSFYLTRLTCSCENSSLMKVKLQYLFDSFNFKIVEHDLSKLLFTLSCHLLVMTQNPSLLTFHPSSRFSVYACV
ncbi:hypothetical protein Hdeb2414_s0008g00290341 [Helianthus debilis subsp. tardiflorus]